MFSQAYYVNAVVLSIFHMHILLQVYAAFVHVQMNVMLLFSFVHPW